MRKQLFAIARLWIFPVLVAAVGIWVVGSAKSFQHCIRDVKYQEAQQSSKEGVSYLLVVFGRYKSCSGVFLIENHDAVIALGTLGLVIFTGTLWWATRGLQRFAEIQSRDMVRSIKATEKAAAAAEKSAHIAERALTELERPYIFVTGIEWGISKGSGTTIELPHVVYTVVNYGKTPAIIEDIRSSLAIGAEPGPLAYGDDWYEFSASPILASDERRGFRRYFPLGGGPEETEVIRNQHGNAKNIPITARGAASPLFWIVIGYRGPFSEEHESSFCWRSDRVTKVFIKQGGAKYNYMK